MQRLEVSCAVRRIYVVRRQRVKDRSQWLFALEGVGLRPLAYRTADWNSAGDMDVCLKCVLCVVK